MYQESVTVHIGANMIVLIFIVIIIGAWLDRRLLRRRGAVGLVATTWGIYRQDRARLQHLLMC